MNCFLHIGTGKTGTKSIQGFLADNRRALRARGYLVPRSAGSPRHTALPLYARGERSNDNLPVAWAKFPDLSSARVDFERRFGEEIGSHPVQNVVMSDEALSTLKSEHIACMVALLSRFFSKIYVIVYLRAQDSHVVSLYQQRIKAGATHSLEEFVNTIHLNANKNYYSKLEKWASAVGRDGIRPRIFDAREFTNGSLIVDFLSVLGIQEYDWFEKQPPENVSLDVESIEFIRLCNTHCFGQFPDKERVRSIRQSLVQALSSSSSGTKLSLPKEIREKLMRFWAESNTKVAKEYFGRPDGILFREMAVAAATGLRITDDRPEGTLAYRGVGALGL